MARPQRNDIDYFPHTVNHGKKMSYIEKKYGNDGYAVWFKILEECGSSDNHYLNLNDEVQIMFLSDRCLVSEEKLINIVEDLIRLNEFNKDLWVNNKILFNEKFVESISDAYKKRKNDCINLKSLHTLLGLKSNPNKPLSNPKSLKQPLKGVENTQTKLKKTKLKKTTTIKAEEDVYLTLDQLKREYLKNEKIVNAVCNVQKINIQDLKKYLDEFILDQTQKGKHSRTKDDFNQHFLNVVKIKKKIKNTTSEKDERYRRAIESMQNEIDNPN